MQNREGSPYQTERRSTVKTNPRRALTVAGFAIALALVASPLNAQQGKFTLPVEARWGNAVLSPGSYRLSGPSPTSTMGVIYIYGDKKAQMALPVVATPLDFSNHSYLRLVNVGGTYVVREFNSGFTGRSYLFGIPKTLKLQMSPKADRQLSTLIDVTGN
jgi:hypothetical protein